ncbi:phosphotransferase [Acetobacter lambici]|uniref:Phosphotransferase n=1 Tax=Acetobacter lambici TaxID=1332824 RepID=A0ABT1F3L0_9PROT|nr:phosphotransferase [Acetobacter lambici]MCP1242515.1 phosphotransferase [Acetobacter lambici]MCP1258733.1 phosphotransferase [Acetobacter lambici]NHO57040.1 phosphotransferase [Acetobacter lambici]
MLEREDILARIPHQGASCLLDTCSSWSDIALCALTTAHLRPDNPLRNAGRLSVLVGAEMAMQAAALHGALTGQTMVRTAGYLAALRDLLAGAERLDCANYGLLQVDVVREQMDSAGMVYGFTIRSQPGDTLLQGRGTVMFHRSTGSGESL